MLSNGKSDREGEDRGIGYSIHGVLPSLSLKENRALVVRKAMLALLQEWKWKRQWESK